MPASLALVAAPDPVRRGQPVALRWDPAGAPVDHELRLTLVVHHKIKLSTMDLDVPGQFGSERQLWRIVAACEAAAGEAERLVPEDAPYSYPDSVLAFFWGIALAPAGAPEDPVAGWPTLKVLP